MSIVVATRILNEEDVVEAFARHHAAQADRLLFLDNGSTDATLPILRALHDEGLPISVVQNRSVHFFEQQHNTFLFRMAVGAQQADWVLHLDADEFLDLRRAGTSLRARLAQVPDTVDALKVALVNYHPSESDDAHDLLVPRRIAQRDPAPLDVWKVFARGRLGARQAVIDAGNHEVIANGAPLQVMQATDMLLAHYPRRSGPHLLAKAVLGRLKVLATGTEAVAHNFSTHYTPIFELMRDDPARLLADPNLMRDATHGLGLVHDPVPYAGAPIRLTPSGDPILRALRTVTAAAERLALQHGRLLDTNEAVRLQVDNWASAFERVV